MAMWQTYEFVGRRELRGMFSAFYIFDLRGAPERKATLLLFSIQLFVFLLIFFVQPQLAI